MVELTPAQKVLAVVLPVYDEEELYFASAEEHASKIAAATLREAANQLRNAYANEEPVDSPDDFLYTMADELENPS
jgi:hypothetical protein